MKIVMMLVALAVTASPLAAGAQERAQATADNEAARTLPVATLTCRDLLQASGQQRDLLLALMHGYVAGKKGLQSVDTVDMSFATDRVVDHCIEAPSDRLLAAFAATEKKTR